MAPAPAQPLQDTRDHSPLTAYLLLAKLLSIPPLPLDRPRQHRRDLVDDEHARRDAAQPAREVEPGPLDPLGEVVRVQHVPEQAGLGHLVVLLDAAGPGALPPGQPRLARLLAAADLAELLVVEVVGRQADVEEGEARRELQGRVRGELPGPGAGGHGPVRGEPAADAGGVDELEGHGGGPDEEVDGRHGRLDEGEDQGAVDVVDDVEGREDLVLPGEVGDAVLRGEGVHHVEEREEAGAFHGHPGQAPGQVKRAVGGRLAHAVPGDEPL